MTDPAGERGSVIPARLAALLLGCAVPVAGCGAGPEHACPAVGWSNTLTVQLADGWPAVDGGSVSVECSPTCGVFLPSAGSDTPTDQLSVPLTGAAVTTHLDMSAPDSAVVTVRAADGADLAKVSTHLDWTRVGGSKECGGPMRATVTVPAP